MAGTQDKMVDPHNTMPVLTVGIIVLNREWIIREMLSSLIKQEYPHHKIHVIVVDGGSKDNTVKIAKEFLENVNFASYEIVIKECNIPEARNICIERMKGEILCFWDSDVLMTPNGLNNLVTPIIEGRADIVSARVSSNIFMQSIDNLESVLSNMKFDEFDKELLTVPRVLMGHTAISRHVLGVIRFDTKFTFCEDADFSVKARRLGFRLRLIPSVKTFDINMPKVHYSNIYASMSLKSLLRALRKKAKVYVEAYSFETNYKIMTSFFAEKKRHTYCLGYPLVFALVAYGIIFGEHWLLLALPLYFVPAVLAEVRRMGVKIGLTAIGKSFIVLFPYSYLLLYYFIKGLRKSSICNDDK